MKRSLRPLLSEGHTVVVPGVGDALCAILSVEAGFPAVYMSGYYVSAVLGLLDVGLVSSSEMVNLIIARTDAIGTSGIDEAIRRGREYRTAGADAVMIMAPRSIEDLARFRESVDGPLVCTVGSWSFNITADELTRIGYQLALFTISTLRRSVVVMREVLARLRHDGGLDHATPEMIPMRDLHRLLGQEHIQSLEKRYASDE
jgi:2-methylisocitrate lyase-like PEP mutase family enzyme